MTKNITLDDLAGMIKGGFDEVDTKFARVEKKLTEHDKRFDKIDKSISNLEFIATEMVRRNEFLELKRKVEILESKFA